MSVAQSVVLRKTLRKQASGMKMVKNRLALRSLKAEFPDALRGAFRQPTAMAYTADDPIKLAKTIKDFSVQNKVLTVKGGVLQGQCVRRRAVRGDHQALRPDRAPGPGRGDDGRPARRIPARLPGALGQPGGPDDAAQ